jgi:Uma2 family endonuclease
MALPIPMMITPSNKPTDSGSSYLILTDEETGLKYKLVVRNGEICLEGADTQAKREINLKELLK